MAKEKSYGERYFRTYYKFEIMRTELCGIYQEFVAAKIKNII
jgi:hypothetical protein